MTASNETEINASVYEWSGRVISVLEKSLGVDIRLHDEHGRINAGDVFLFNHFARFETFIPQYLIHRETGAYCRAVAASEFFVDDDPFSNYLLNVGAVPNNHPRLLPYLAEEVLRGRKVIVFPEGGMVKDRRVLDRRGRYSIYSRVAEERRKHHTGAAILSLTIDAFKTALLAVEAMGDTDTVRRWAERLRLDDAAQLSTVIRRPTLIIPSNITFYPLRVTDNILRQGVDLFTSGLKPQFAEELLIEGNILLKRTDMDIRMGEPVRPGKVWHWLERRALVHIVRDMDALDTLFELSPGTGGWRQRLIAMSFGRKALRLRDAYMRAMYDEVTVNLSHLTSKLILEYMAGGDTEVDRPTFERALYLAVHYVRQAPAIHAHLSLANPHVTLGLLEGECEWLDRFLASKLCTDLVRRDKTHYWFLPKLRGEQDFDSIRIENLIAVYANEMTPIKAAREAVAKAIKDAATVDAKTLAHHMFDDEVASFAYDKNHFTKPRHSEINEQETATKSGAPYLHLPQKANPLGVVLVHGFLASPAELAELGDTLAAAGHRVMGVRLRGHGTSPWDLRDRTWQNWLNSVRRGHRIMAGLAERVVMVGFSTGGSLSLLLAAETPERLAGVAAVSAPLKFRNRNMVFVPLLHRANRLASWVPSLEGLIPFRENESEHPDINYRNIPVRGLYELRLMVAELEKRLGDVTCPTLVVQGDEDHVVDPISARIIVDGLGTPDEDKSLHLVPTARHGILNEDVGDSRRQVLDFVTRLAEDEA